MPLARALHRECGGKRLGNSRRWRVAVPAIAHGFMNGLNEVRGCLKIENIGIAYIEW